MSDEQPGVGLSNKQALEIWQAFIRRLGEIVNMDIQKDIDGVDDLDLWEQLEVRAYWGKWVKNDPDYALSSADLVWHKK